MRSVWGTWGYFVLFLLVGSLGLFLLQTPSITAISHVSGIISTDTIKSSVDGRIVTFADTGSMEPTFGAGSRAIVSKVNSAGDLRVGDVIVYANGEISIAHRIVVIGTDSEGWYAITKGDANSHVDSAKVRFDQVRGIVSAVFY